MYVNVLGVRRRIGMNNMYLEIINQLPNTFNYLTLVIFAVLVIKGRG